MTDREFRRLTREDLLDIIYELQQKTQRLFFLLASRLSGTVINDPSSQQFLI